MNIMSFFLCFASLISSPAIVLVVAGSQETARTTPTDTDVCAAQKCSPTGPAVRFPFMIRGKQPEHCGYDSGYMLHCDELNRTILELPSSSIKVEVIRISYLFQMMQLQSLQPCLAKHLTNLDLSFSTTPFRYPWDTPPGYYYDPRYYVEGWDIYDVVREFSLFNCPNSTVEKKSHYLVDIHCLGNNGSKVYARISYSGVDEELESCTKMYDTKFVQEEMLYNDSMTLSWSLPRCRRCEGQGGVCRWKNGSSNKIGCLGGNKHHSEIMKKLYISGSILGCLFFMVLATSAVYLAYSRNKQDKENQVRLKKFLEDYAAIKPTRYSYADIKKITNDFKNKLGGGAYGNVFKGKVSNDIFVAVKLLLNSTENGEEFINEVGTMGKIHHINVVRLLGFCADGYNKALVYEFLPNGSLDKFIFPDGQEHHTLSMEMLQAIAIGIARGIEYLHQGCEQRILHFDIKPHNILLDKNYNPKLSDFGLAKLCEMGRSVVSMTAARGTMGYIAPEVFSRQFGNVSYKSDIYSFGMLLLEMVGRRKNIDSNVQNISQVYFPEWVYGRLIKGEELRIQVEEKEDGEDKIAKRLAVVGLWCIQWNPINRPSIKFVLQMLEGTTENLILPPNPFTSGSTMNAADPSREEHTRAPLGFTLDVISEYE